MICLIKRPIKPFICIAFLWSGVYVNAQVSLVQQAIDKIEGYKNFSYQSVYKQKEYTSDTIIMEHKDIFLKAPEDKTFGYLFSMETLIKGNKFPYIDLYNGQNLIGINPEDSTYIMKKIQASAAQGSLLDYLKMIEGLFEKRPSKIDRDTTINGIICSHLVVNTYDTIINKQHYYTRIHIFIDKLSGMPNSIMAKSRNAHNGDGITNYYSEFRYFDYKLNKDNVDIASMAIPKGFHPPKERPALLASGTVAPDWVLYSAEGKKVSLVENTRLLTHELFF